MNKEDKQLTRFTDDIYDKLLDHSGGPYTPFNRKDSVWAAVDATKGLITIDMPESKFIITIQRNDKVSTEDALSWLSDDINSPENIAAIISEIANGDYGTNQLVKDIKSYEV